MSKRNWDDFAINTVLPLVATVGSVAALLMFAFYIGSCGCYIAKVQSGMSPIAAEYVCGKWPEIAASYGCALREEK